MILNVSFMYELKKKIGKLFTSKFVGTGPSSYEKSIYGAAVSQRLRNTTLKRTKGESFVMGSQCSELGKSEISCVRVEWCDFFVEQISQVTWLQIQWLRYGLDDPRFQSRWEQEILLFFTTHSPALRTTHPPINPLAPDFFFLILAHPVFTMLITQEPKKVALWNKRHFEEKKRRVCSMFKIFCTCICWINI